MMMHKYLYLVVLFLSAPNLAESKTDLVKISSWDYSLDKHHGNEAFQFSQYQFKGKEVYFVSFLRGKRLIAQEAVTKNTWNQWKNQLLPVETKTKHTKCVSPANTKGGPTSNNVSVKTCLEKMHLKDREAVVGQINKHLFKKSGTRR